MKKSVVVKKTTPIQAGKQSKEVATIDNKNNEKHKLSLGVEPIKGDVYNIVGVFIPKREGRLHLCAYKDHTRYSIGYGTKSFAGECITEAEAIQRFKDATAWRVERVVRDYPGLLPYQHAALVSLFYNCNSCYLRVGKTVEKGDFNRSSGIVAKFPGLKKRTRAEQDLYFYGVMY